MLYNLAIRQSNFVFNNELADVHEQLKGCFQVCFGTVIFFIYISIMCIYMLMYSIFIIHAIDFESRSYCMP